MKIGVIPENPLERLADLFGMVPRPILETVTTMFMSRVLMAGVRLGVFDHLAKHGGQTSEEIAAALGLHESALGFLARSLVALGYLEVVDGRFQNSAPASRFLVHGAPGSVADFVDFNYDQWEVWSGIEETIRTGEHLDVYHIAAGIGLPEATNRGTRRLREYAEAEGGHLRLLERSTRGLRDLARYEADEIYYRLWLPSSIRSLLDIAGGHGGFSIAFCKRYPELRSTVFELGETAKVGRKIVEEEGFASRIEFVEGDVRSADLGRDRDLVFYFNIAHHLSDDDNRAVFRRVLECLSADSHFVIMDMFEEAGGGESFMASAFGLFFQRTSAAKNYRAAVLVEWLKATGFASVWTVPLRSSGGTHALIVGRK